MPEAAAENADGGFSSDITPATQTEQRIAWLTLFFGALATVAAAPCTNRVAGGLMVVRFSHGSIPLAAPRYVHWLRPRRLKPVFRSLVYRLARTRVLFRYALIAITVYVIFKLLKFPR
jgi:hypothetical protein